LNQKLAALLAATFVAAPALAAGPIDGTWKADLKSAQMPKKPDVYSLQNGVFTCSSCIPAVRVAADGRLHPVRGHSYYDAMAIKVVDPHTIAMMEAKAGKTVFTMTEKVNGTRLSFHFHDMTSPKPVDGAGTEVRVAAGPAGSHAVSGSWRNTSMDSMTDAGLTVTFRTTSDTVRMSSPTGVSYEARIGGPYVPIHGDPGGTSASVSRVNATTLRETDKRGGKVVGVTTMAVAGRTMTTTVEDKVQGTTMTYKSYRQ
jgi:hypothetical protein